MPRSRDISLLRYPASVCASLEKGTPVMWGVAARVRLPPVLRIAHFDHCKCGAGSCPSEQALTAVLILGYAALQHCVRSYRTSLFGRGQGRLLVCGVKCELSCVWKEMACRSVSLAWSVKLHAVHLRTEQAPTATLRYNARTVSQSTVIRLTLSLCLFMKALLLEALPDGCSVAQISVGAGSAQADKADKPCSSAHQPYSSAEMLTAVPLSAGRGCLCRCAHRPTT